MQTELERQRKNLNIVSTEFNQITIAARLREYGFRNRENISWEIWDSDQGMRNPNSTEKELKIQVQIARNPETKTLNQESPTARNPESITVLDYFTWDEPQQFQNGILTLSY